SSLLFLLSDEFFHSVRVLVLRSPKFGKSILGLRSDLAADRGLNGEFVDGLIPSFADVFGETLAFSGEFIDCRRLRSCGLGSILCVHSSLIITRCLGGQCLVIQSDIEMSDLVLGRPLDG